MAYMHFKGNFFEKWTIGYYQYPDTFHSVTTQIVKHYDYPSYNVEIVYRDPYGSYTRNAKVIPFDTFDSALAYAESCVPVNELAQ
jgi:hypothetical protein